MNKSKPVVFIISTGLGHVNRGYESFTRECFSAIEHSKYFNIFLLKGGGKTKGKEIKINCIRRSSNIGNFTSKLLSGKDKYWTEQITFLIGLIPYIIWYKPAIIYYSDIVLGKFMWHLRKHLKFKYKLLFSNGAPLSPPFIRMDHVQQLLPVFYNYAINIGEPASIQTLLPYGFDINIQERINDINTKDILRNQLGFSKDQKIILSVGAINKQHKRMDYLINEIASVNDKNIFLIILGQEEEETAEIKKLAEEKLEGRFLITSVPSNEVKKYYIISDYFVLASLVEGFGRVLVEALSYGLICIVHDYINSKEVLKENGIYIDMQIEGGLCSFFESNNTISNDKEKIIKATYQSYSWDKLAPKYEEMILKLSESSI